jgi:energy-coupling factor transporter transmembrane protein EcfT
MEVISNASGAILDAAFGFLAWLGIHPTLQDLVKALILVVFVLAILMIVGDVYRGEIQNKLHRIRLIRHPASYLSNVPRDITLQVPQSVVDLTLNNIFSNGLIYLRYRDSIGRLCTKRIIDYRVRFRVRLQAFAQNTAPNRMGDHDYTAEETERLSNEPDPAIVSMAASRVDYIYEGLVDKFQQRQVSEYKRLQASPLLRFFKGIRNQQLVEPEFVGLCMKFHFPINPHFLLYKHPDTNVRTTAWLTVLTSVFALFMQLIYASGTDSASAVQSAERPAIVRSANAN